MSSLLQNHTKIDLSYALDVTNHFIHARVFFGLPLQCHFCSSLHSSLQVLGGNGYMGEYQIEQLWRDSKLLEIGGGTNEAHHKNMIRDLKRNPETLK